MSRLKQRLIGLAVSVCMIAGCIPITHVEAADDTAESLLAGILETVPEIEGGHLVLPDIESTEYRVELAGTSNEAVIDAEGNVYTPLETMDVKVMYRVVSQSDEADYAMEDGRDVTVTVPGEYEPEDGDNERPQVVPGIREWKGAAGSFELRENSHIVAESEKYKESADNLAWYFQEMLGIDLAVETGTAPQDGDIFLCGTEHTELGEEGNYIEIGDYVTIQANTAIGALYGGTTLTQILSQDREKRSLPKGYIRDYPAYEIRAAMLDVARFYMPIEYLEEITRYMAYFKMNEIHVHINDDGGEQSSSFRVESKLYPEINSTLPADEVYTQEQYRQYQLDVMPLGIDVITEIDTPAHCGFVNLLSEEHKAQYPDIMLDESHINLGNEKAVEFMQSLYEEMLLGAGEENAVFLSDSFHLGADEYRRDAEGESTNGENYRNYVNKMIEYLNGIGKQPRIWASLGGGGMKGTTEVSTDVISNYWAYSWADFPQMIKKGYRCINTSTDLYIVPGTSTGYEDFLPFEDRYETWEVHMLGGGTTLSPAHPLLMGCESALWYDRKVGMSQFDYFDRLRDQIMLISEKGWYGEKDEDQTFEDFQKRIALTANRAPGSNPARFVETDSEVAAEYDFEEVNGTTVSDRSKNAYDAEISDLTVTEGRKGQGLSLNGNGFLSLPFDTIGFPYTVSFDLYLDENSPEDAVLFRSGDGVLYLNYKGSGCIGYERKGYQYLLDHKLDTGRWLNIMLTCDSYGLNLYIDDVFKCSGVYYTDRNGTPESSTFVLPLETIGSGVVGVLDNLKITNTYNSYEKMYGLDQLGYGNLALFKDTEVSGLEVPGQFLGENAVDGKTGDWNLRVSLERVDDAWFQVDLGEEYLIDQVNIDFNERPNAYQIQISSDGKEWNTVYENLACGGASKGIDSISLDEPVTARYVRYQQLKMFDAGYSGNFYEVEVYGYAGLAELGRTLNEAKNVLENTEITDENRAYMTRFAKNVTLFEEAMEQTQMEEKCWMGVRIAEQIERIASGDTDVETVDISKLEKLLATEINRDFFDEDTLKEYDKACLEAKFAIFNIDGDQAGINVAYEELKAVVDALKDNAVTVTANNPAWTRNEPLYQWAHAADGDKTTFTWISSAQTVGDWFQFSLRYPEELHNIQVFIDESATDIIGKSDVEVSMDGTNWTKVAELEKTHQQIVSFEPVEAQYFRFVITEGTGNWTRIDEVTFNVVDVSALEAALAQTYEEGQYTADSYAAYLAVRSEAEELLNDEYKTDADVAKMVEDLNAAAEALVTRGNRALVDAKIQEIRSLEEALYTEASWTALNTAVREAEDALEEAGNNLTEQDVEELLEALRTAQAKLVTKASEKKEALAAYIRDNGLEQIAGDNYLTEDFRTFTESLNHAKELINSETASAADYEQALTGLKNAKEALRQRASGEETAALRTLAQSYDSAVYTPDSWKKFETVLQRALDALAENEMTSEDVADLDAALKEADDFLVVKADKTNLEEVVKAAGEKREAEYTAESWSILAKALQDAETVSADENAEQAEVDAAAAAIEDAIAKLEFKGADYTKADEAIAKVNALNKENYKDFSAVEAAVKAVVKGKDITEQEAVDAMAKAINDAVAALELKDADYTAVDEAVAKADALNKDDYKDFSAVEAAIKAVVRGKDITEQDAVDKMAEDIEAAIAGLEKKDPPLPQELPYEDVNEDDWFYDYVYDVYVKELMTGLTETVFAPNNSLVRAQFAVIVYRMEGEPKVTFKDTFPDVKDGNFYSNAVIWAAENGIVTGYTNTGLFGPNDPITREQMAAMMFRYANYKELDTDAREDLSAFPDENKVQEFATDAVKWCVAEGIISGKGEEGAKILDPQGNTVRAEAAAIISRYTEIDK